MPSRPRAALALFARHPSGRVKTRLVPPLTPAQAREFHRACLESTARLALSLPPAVDKWIYLTPDRPAAPGLPAELHLPAAFRVAVQRGRDLGSRLRAAWRQLQTRGYRRIVFLGSDSPTLPPLLLRRAFVALRRADAVLGPARDGGYYLLGLRVEGKNPPDVFRAIPWGTPRAFRHTRARLRRAGCRTVVLPPWHDLDVPADLRRLERELRTTRRAHLAPLRMWLAGNNLGR